MNTLITLHLPRRLSGISSILRPSGSCYGSRRLVVLSVALELRIRSLTWTGGRRGG